MESDGVRRAALGGASGREAGRASQGQAADPCTACLSSLNGFDAARREEGKQVEIRSSASCHNGHGQPSIGYGTDDRKTGCHYYRWAGLLLRSHVFAINAPLST